MRTFGLRAMCVHITIVIAYNTSVRSSQTQNCWPPKHDRNNICRACCFSPAHARHSSFVSHSCVTTRNRELPEPGVCILVGAYRRRWAPIRSEMRAKRIYFEALNCNNGFQITQVFACSMAAGMEMVSGVTPERGPRVSFACTLHSCE